MKNQRRQKQKDRVKGTWEKQYHGAQEAHDTAAINDTKTAHRKKKKMIREKK